MFLINWQVHEMWEFGKSHCPSLCVLEKHWSYLSGKTQEWYLLPYRNFIHFPELCPEKKIARCYFKNRIFPR
jgi:hypothetical protein